MRSLRALYSVLFASLVSRVPSARCGCRDVPLALEVSLAHGTILEQQLADLIVPA